MALLDISSIETTNLSNELTKPSINQQNTSIGTYTPDWTKWYGYYKGIAELQSIIDKVAIWSAGLNITAKEKNKQIFIDRLRGNGKDTFSTIAQNLIRTSKICGDSFAEIIRNRRGELINLKPLDPSTISIHQNSGGIITKYSQGSDEIVWNPDDMFHLIWNRIASENHGISTIEKLEKIILYRLTAHTVMNTIIERHARPIVIIEADTDDVSEINSLKSKYKTLIDKGEAMVVPKDTMTLKDFAQKIGIDPITWMNYLNKYFVQAEGVPMVILGTSGNDTEGEAKILHLAYEQVVKHTQNWFTTQFKAQIGFDIELEKPISIDPMVLTDTRKSSKGENLKDVNPAGQNK